MTKGEILISYMKIAMAKENVTQKELADRLGCKAQSLVQLFGQNNVTVNRIAEVFDALGYHLEFNLVKKELRENYENSLPRECPYAPAGILHIQE